MKLKAKTEPGKCSVSRCGGGYDLQQTADNPHGLCNQHWNEWSAAGKPDLQAAAPRKQKGENTELATVGAELAPLRNSLDAVLQQISGMSLTEQAHLDYLGLMRETARKQIEVLEEKRTSITKPLLEAKRAADALFKPVREQCEAIMGCCSRRLEEFSRARAAAQDAALGQVQLGARDADTLVVAHGAGALQLPDTVREATTWSFEVIDGAAVPMQFLCINERAVLAFIKETKGTVEIPGLRILRSTEIKTKVAG